MTAPLLLILIFSVVLPPLTFVENTIAPPAESATLSTVARSRLLTVSWKMSFPVLFNLVLPVISNASAGATVAMPTFPSLVIVIPSASETPDVVKCILVLFVSNISVWIAPACVATREPGIFISNNVEVSWTDESVIVDSTDAPLTTFNILLSVIPLPDKNVGAKLTKLLPLYFIKSPLLRVPKLTFVKLLSNAIFVFTKLLPLYFNKSLLATFDITTSPNSFKLSILSLFSHLLVVELYFNISLFANDVIFTSVKSLIVNVFVSHLLLVELYSKISLLFKELIFVSANSVKFTKAFTKLLDVELYFNIWLFATFDIATSVISFNVSILLTFSHLPLVELYFNISPFANDVIFTSWISFIDKLLFSHLLLVELYFNISPLPTELKFVSVKSFKLSVLLSVIVKVKFSHLLVVELYLKYCWFCIC